MHVAVHYDFHYITVTSHQSHRTPSRLPFLLRLRTQLELLPAICLLDQFFSVRKQREQPAIKFALSVTHPLSFLDANHCHFRLFNTSTVSVCHCLSCLNVSSIFKHDDVNVDFSFQLPAGRWSGPLEWFSLCYSLKIYPASASSCCLHSSQHRFTLPGITVKHLRHPGLRTFIDLVGDSRKTVAAGTIQIISAVCPPRRPCLVANSRTTQRLETDFADG